MGTEPGDVGFLRFSTDELPERERLPMMREVWGRLFMHLEWEPLPDTEVHLNLVARALPQLTVSTLVGSAIRSERTPALMSDGIDDIFLGMPSTAGHVASHLGREVVIAANSGLALSLADPITCTTVGSSHWKSVSIPRKVLAPLVPGLEDALQRPLHGEAFNLLKGYVDLLGQDQTLASLPLRQLVVTHVHDLVALALGASRDAAEVAKVRGLRAARLHAIK